MTDKTLQSVASAKLIKFMRENMRFEKHALLMINQDIIPCFECRGRGKVREYTGSFECRRESTKCGSCGGTKVGPIEPWKDCHKNHLAYERKAKERQARERRIIASIRSKLTDEEIQFVTNRGVRL